MPLSKPVFEFLKIFWPIARFGNAAFRTTPLMYLAKPLFDSEINEEVILPIYQDINIPPSTALPYQFLEECIEMADFAVVMNECLCRRVEKCQTFPRNLGCLFLGEGAREIHSTLAHPVSKAEAKAHLQKAFEYQLTPMIIHSWFDSAMLGIPFQRMAAICFCCSCCCTVHNSLSLGPAAYFQTAKPFPGVTITVTDRCIGCGICLTECSLGGLEMVSNQAQITAKCLGCGRCVLKCPNDAIQISYQENEIAYAQLFERVSALTSQNKII